MEIWKDIKDFEGKYQVSTEGNVMSLNYNNTGTPKILKPKINKQGYLEITLNKEDKHYYRMINRLVIETFTDIKLTKNDIIMYQDNDKTNCSLENMYLITRGKRQELTYETGKRYVEKVEFYDEKVSLKEISKRTGVDTETVRHRIKVLGWNTYEAVEVPVAIMKRRKINASKL